MKYLSNKAAPFTLMPVAAALPLLFSAQMAQADCTTNSTSTLVTYTCGGAQTSTVTDIQTTATKVDALNWDLGIQSFNLQDNDPIGKTPITFIGDHVSSNSTASFAIRLTGNGNIDTTLTNSNLTVNGTSGSAISLNNLTSGTQTVNLTDTNITMVNGGGVGITAANTTTTAGAVSTINFTGGTITANTNGAGIYAAMINGVGGDINITTKNAIINVSRDGILADNQGSTGNIFVDNDSAITSTDDGGHGISTLNHATSGTTTIINKNTLSATGYGARAISAQSDAGSSVNITNTGTVTSNDNAIFGYTNAGGGSHHQQYGRCVKHRHRYQYSGHLYTQ